jgi:hypothetical protein
MSVRKNPLVCLLLSLGRLLVGRLRYSNEYVGTTLKVENGEEYYIFRHIRAVSQPHNEQGSVMLGTLLTTLNNLCKHDRSVGTGCLSTYRGNRDAVRL